MVVCPRVNSRSSFQGVFFNSLSGCLDTERSPMPAMMNLIPAKIQMEKRVISNPSDLHSS